MSQIYHKARGKSLKKISYTFSKVTKKSQKSQKVTEKSKNHKKSKSHEKVKKVTEKIKKSQIKSTRIALYAIKYFPTFVYF